ncbi:MAG: hypothetical protein HDR11_05075 [Lachnospiraceae bacterium]|nr:hypothetical protein [Lachnospiraceae bacterium]
MDTNFSNHLTMENIEERYKEVCLVIGLDNYIKLCKFLGGTTLYVPTIKQLSKKYIKSCILASKDSLSVSQIARAYGVSDSFVYSTIKEGK